MMEAVVPLYIIISAFLLFEVKSGWHFKLRFRLRMLIQYLESTVNIPVTSRDVVMPLQLSHELFKE